MTLKSGMKLNYCGQLRIVLRKRSGWWLVFLSNYKQEEWGAASADYIKRGYDRRPDLQQ